MDKPRPVCFMVMPFGTKSVPRPPSGAPTEVDFNALWSRALMPAIEAAGYEAVRADQDLGAMIIKDMIERLAWADLVVADLTLPNANVYYEIGVRHAARRTGCVLVAADWSQQVFDLDQIRSLRYPMPEGAISDDTAAGIRAALTPNIRAMAEGESPVWQSVPTYDVRVEGDPPKTFRRFVERLSTFQARVRAIQVTPRELRAEKALELCTTYADGDGILPAVAMELLFLVRDHAGWDETLQLIDGFPERIRGLALVREQRALALANTSDPATAIGELEQLIAEQGDTPERSGLIGGRFKRLYRSADNPIERNHYLDQAIDAYDRGMMLDLNEYFCSSNLAQLYRARGREGDESRAVRAATATVAACRRAEALGGGDAWLHPTLLGAAFDTRDPEQAQALLPLVEKEPARWKLETTVVDLAERAGQIEDAGLSKTFQDIVDTLKQLLG